MTIKYSKKGTEAIKRLEGYIPAFKQSKTLAEFARNHKSKYIPTGFPGLEWAIGRPGLPAGCVQVLAQSQAGKTTLVAQIVREAQQAGIRCAWIDMEQAQDEQWELLQNLGVDLEELTYILPESGEQAIEAVRTLAHAGDWGLIVFDSIGAINTEKMLDRETGESLPGKRAALVSEMLINCNPYLVQNSVCCVLINHFTGTMKADLYGNQKMVPAGGEKLNLIPVLRIDMKRIEDIVGEKKEIIGSKVSLTIQKNRLGTPKRTIILSFFYGSGFDAIADTITEAKKHGVTETSGSWFIAAGQKFHGEAKFLEHVMNDPTFARKLLIDTRAAIEASRLEEGQAKQRRITANRTMISGAAQEEEAAA
jgi:recombination protein RecA